MNDMPQLTDAYALRDPDGVRDLYAEWAPSYDTGFVSAMGYQLPVEVARAFVAGGGTGPVLDVGAGTGLVAEHLAKLNIGPIDAVDLSPQMLDVARGKQVYRALFADNFTEANHSLEAGGYSGIVSAGTFTHGHLGPEGLAPLLPLLRPGGTATLSINLEHYNARDFGAVLAMLEPDLAELTHRDVRIYDARADKAHRDDLARIVTLTKR